MAELGYAPYVYDPASHTATARRGDSTYTNVLYSVTALGATTG